MSNRMSVLEKLSQSQIIIFGLGREGLSTYRFLRSELPLKKIILIDERPVDELMPAWSELLKKDKAATFTTSFTKIDQDQLRSSLLFKTPGIPKSHPIVQQVLDAGSKFTSNTQLFFKLVEEYNAECATKNLLKNSQNKEGRSPLITIGVTGTKGKSTTSSVTYHLLKENNLPAYLGGNIGKPALDIWAEWKKQQSLISKHSPQKNKNQSAQKADFFMGIFVLELSCHQLAELKSSPEIAVVQDIVSEHLDYYENFADYLQAKTQIARFQKKTDMIIYNQDSTTAPELATLSPAEKISFSLKEKKDPKNEAWIKLAKNTQLLGEHNLYNLIPAIIIGQKFGLKEKQIKSAIQSFKALPHRLEFVANINQVRYYDDSISTVPEATIAALHTFADKPIILIAGGFERQQNYQQLAEEVLKSNVKALALLPPTGQRLLRELSKLDPPNTLRAATSEFSEMSEAVRHAFNHAKSGDVVLLSPGAASFNSFKDYRDRGEQFKKEVLKLKG